MGQDYFEKPDGHPKKQYECQGCGAIVTDIKIHNRFHREIGHDTSPEPVPCQVCGQSQWMHSTSFPDQPIHDHAFEATE